MRLKEIVGLIIFAVIVGLLVNCFFDRFDNVSPNQEQTDLKSKVVGKLVKEAYDFARE